jgi:hypothetical protein
VFSICWVICPDVLYFESYIYRLISNCKFKGLLLNDVAVRQIIAPMKRVQDCTQYSYQFFAVTMLHFCGSEHANLHALWVCMLISFWMQVHQWFSPEVNSLPVLVWKLYNNSYTSQRFSLRMEDLANLRHRIFGTDDHIVTGNLSQNSFQFQRQKAPGGAISGPSVNHWACCVADQQLKHYSC